METLIIGGKTTRLHSNAATPIRYKTIFKKDLMIEISKMQKGESSESEIYELPGKLAFIMNMQAEKTKEELGKLSEEDYYSWLEDFEGAMCFVDKTTEIISIYMGNVKGDSTSKKAEDLPSESLTQQSIT